MDEQVTVLSGVHGNPDGTWEVDSSFYTDDVTKWGHIDGVTVYDVSKLPPSQITALLNGKGTTIGGFCWSAACLARYW